MLQLLFYLRRTSETLTIETKNSKVQQECDKCTQCRKVESGTWKRTTSRESRGWGQGLLPIIAEPLSLAGGRGFSEGQGPRCGKVVSTYPGHLGSIVEFLCPHRSTCNLSHQRWKLRPTAAFYNNYRPVWCPLVETCLLNPLFSFLIIYIKNL